MTGCPGLVRPFFLLVYSRINLCDKNFFIKIKIYLEKSKTGVIFADVSLLAPLTRRPAIMSFACKPPSQVFKTISVFTLTPLTNEKTLLLLMVLVMTAVSVIADSFHYDPHSNMRIPANETSLTAVTVSPDSTGITVFYSLGSMYFHESEVLTNCYSISLQDFGHFIDGISPDVPFRVDYFTLPIGVWRGKYCG